MKVHIRASGVPFTAWVPCAAGAAGARAVDVVGAPTHVGTTRAAETVCTALNGWGRHMGETPDPERTLDTRPHRMRWAHAHAVGQAAASLERAERTRTEAPAQAQGALSALAGGALEAGVAQGEVCAGCDARANDRLEQAWTQAIERCERADETFERAREGQNGETTAGWMKAMRALSMSGDAKALERMADALDAREQTIERGRGPVHAHEGSEHTIARGWTQRLGREGGGLEAGAACARAQAAYCAATNAYIAALDPAECQGALERVARWMGERQMMVAISGEIVWDVHGVSTAGALAAGAGQTTRDEEIAARAGAHTQLTAHPEGVIAATRAGMLERGGANDQARAEQSQRWANEGCLRMEGSPDGPGPAALTLGVALSEARTQGAPVLAVRPEVVRGALEEAGEGARATQRALLQAQRLAGTESARAVQRGRER